jgi:hypothetical protein
MADLRVAPPRIFPVATRAAKPPMEAAGSADAYRQTTFDLGAEVDLVLRGLNLEGEVAQASAGAKFRKQPTAAAMGLWSRGWLTRLEALHALEWGNYVAAMPLLRAAADSVAGEIYLLQQNAAEWEEWLDQGGISAVPGDQAIEFRLHAFRAAEVLARHERLGQLYRVVTDLSLPHFGSTLLLTANDSNPERVLMTFGDRDFHLGLAELCLGWLLALGVAQFEAVADAGAVLGDDPESRTPWCVDAEAMIARADRCRVDVVDRDGSQRYLVQNWRRGPAAARKRVLL